jgi:PAS domain S-box-containing protein
VPADATAVFVGSSGSWRVRSESPAWATVIRPGPRPADKRARPADTSGSFDVLSGDPAAGAAAVRLLDLVALTGTARQATIALEDRLVRLIVTPLPGADGDIAELLATVRSLPDGNAPSLTDAPPGLVASFGRDLRVVAVNDAVLEVSGLTRAQIIGRTNVEMGYAPSLSELWDGLYRQVFASGHPAAMRYDLPGVDGCRRYATEIVPVFDSDGEVVVVTATSVDVSERRDPHHTYDRLETQVAAMAASVGRARREVVAHVHATGASRIADAVEIVVAELVTNAVRHGSDALVRISAHHALTHYVLAVHQACSGTHIPEPHRWTMPPNGSPSGRGLAIVKALTADVELDTSPHHTEVRCTFSFD